MRIFTYLCIFFVLGPLISTSKAQDLNNLQFTVSDAPEWSNLFKRTRGWFGGDGIFSIPLNGKEAKTGSSGKTLIVFSDTMIGEISNGKLQSGSQMIHNSAATLNGHIPDPKKIQFFYQPDGQNTGTLFVPKTPKTEKGDYFWLGDGFVNTAINNDIFIFGYRIRSVTDATFCFAEVGNTILRISGKKPLRLNNYTQRDTPFYLSEEDGEMGSFGAGIFVNTKSAGATNPDGFIYIYGVLGKNKKLLAARVRPANFDDYTKWLFWDGNGWQKEIEKSAPVTDQVSNELSLSQLPDGRYILVFQESGMGRHVAIRLGKTPVGPFGPIIRIWDTADALQLRSFFSYNAKAHPSLSANGELLISYNVNSFDFFNDLKIHPQLYRPRFIKLKFK